MEPDLHVEQAKKLFLEYAKRRFLQTSAKKTIARILKLIQLKMTFWQKVITNSLTPYTQRDTRCFLPQEVPSDDTPLPYTQGDTSRALFKSL